MPDTPKVVTTYEEALEVGYLGTVPDETPNEAYTVAGVTSSDTAAKADRKAAAGETTKAPPPTKTAKTTEPTEPAETKSSKKPA